MHLGLFASQRNSAAEDGISLYTLLAAVVVLGVLTSVLVTSFTGTHSKGQALWAMMHNVGNAAQQFKLDTSCYPVNMDALWDYDKITASAHHNGNSCDAVIPKAQWHGPYVKRMEVTGIDDVYLSQFGPNTIIALDYFGQNHKPNVWAHGAPKDIIDETYNACGGDASLCVKDDSHSLRYFYTGKM